MNDPDIGTLKQKAHHPLFVPKAHVPALTVEFYTFQIPFDKERPRISIVQGPFPSYL